MTGRVDNAGRALLEIELLLRLSLCYHHAPAMIDTLVDTLARF